MNYTGVAKSSIERGIRLHEEALATAIAGHNTQAAEDLRFDLMRLRGELSRRVAMRKYRAEQRAARQAASQ